MEYEVRYLSISKMIDLVEEIKKGRNIRTKLEEILKHDDYQFEFSRYEGRIDRDEFIDYIYNINNLKEADITNIDLKVHHKYYRDLYDNTDYYREKLREFRDILKENTFKDQLELATKGLPSDFRFPKLKFIFTMGIGQSFGYAHNNGMHFDFLKMVKENNLKKFVSIIGHEAHHVALNIIENSMDMNNISLEEYFYLCFTGEGLAVKYCNNAKGVISRPIYDGDINIGLDKFTWGYLNNDFDNTFIMFKKTINDIRDGEYKNIDDLMYHLKDYWMNPYTDEQVKGDIPKLQHFRLYTFGNDIWGVIHDVFGKEIVYDTLRNPSKFVDTYNKSVTAIDRIDLMI